MNQQAEQFDRLPLFGGENKLRSLRQEKESDNIEMLY